jgi:hypothetical protein
MPQEVLPLKDCLRITRSLRPKRCTTALRFMKQPKNTYVITYHYHHSLDYAKAALDALNAKRGKKLCEYKMGLTENLEPCDFFAKDVWFRGAADLIILDEEAETAWVIDYKTTAPETQC